jgi:hypothetical protein
MRMRGIRTRITAVPFRQLPRSQAEDRAKTTIGVWSVMTDEAGGRAQRPAMEPAHRNDRATATR